MDVDTTIFITTVVALVTTNLGALYFMSGRIGGEVDALGGRIDHLTQRVDGMDERLTARMDAMDERLTARMDTVQGAIADVGGRLTALERRG